MSDNKDKKGLGRGLSALMADVAPAAAPVPVTGQIGAKEVPIEDVHPNPEQPRRDFTEADLNELADSIAQKGIIQPILVREKSSSAGNYQIVAGERRWRAAQRAKLHTVPVLIKDFSDQEVLEIALIENIQRADLNPIEEATAYRQLQEKFGHTQEQLSQELGKSRSHIANSMRLLGLPEDVLKLVREGTLSAGHARALLTTDDPSGLAQLVVRKSLSVRETEKLAKSAGIDTSKPAKAVSRKDADTRRLEEELSATLGLKVQIDHDPGMETGKLTIGYKKFDQLDDLCAKLSR